jgi:NADPH:quinone reductase
MAKLRGAKVIGVVSSGEKADIAREAGAAEVIVFAPRLRAGGSVADRLARRQRRLRLGSASRLFERSLTSLAPLGMTVL